MSTKSRRGATLVAVIMFLSAVASTAQSWRGPADLEVRVSSRKGGNLAGARVELMYRDGRDGLGPPAVATNSQGRAILAGLAAGTWQVEVSHPKFMSFVAVVQLDAKAKPQITASFLEASAGSVAPIQVKLMKSKGGTPSPPLPMVATAPPRQEEPAATPAPTVRPEPAQAQPEAVQPEAVQPEAVEPEPVQPEPAPVPQAQPVQPMVEPVAQPEPMQEPAPQPADPVEPAPMPDPMPIAEPEPESAPEVTADSTPGPTAEQASESIAEQTAEQTPEPTPAMPAPVEAPPMVEEPEPQPMPMPMPEPDQPKPSIEQPVVETPEVVAQAPEVMPAPVEEVMPEVAAAVEPEPMPEPEPEPEPEVEAPMPKVEPEPMPAPATVTPMPEPTPPPASPQSSSPEATWRSYRQRNCPECRPGQWAVTVSANLTAGESCSSAASGAAEAGSNMLGERAELEAFAGAVDQALSLVQGQPQAEIANQLATAQLGGCRLLGVTLPTGSRFVDFQYEHESSAGRHPCQPDQPCADDGPTFIGTPRVTSGAAATVVHTLAHGDDGTALMTVLFRAPSDRWAPPPSN